MLRFLRSGPPVLTMGGLCVFETATGKSAPAVLDALAAQATIAPDKPLPAPLVADLAGLTASALKWSGVAAPRATRRAHRMLASRPEELAAMLTNFLADPIPSKPHPAAKGSANLNAQATGLPSALTLRADWIAAGFPAAAFEPLALWQHARIGQARQSAQISAMCDAAVAARAAQLDGKDFRHWLDEVTRAADAASGKPKPDLWQSLDATTAHLPRLSAEEFARMKGLQ
ncbi:hypothetical protein [Shimia ponticola]|uniref:hypothetical protein n=1 Tax=Shimia ponticola TaxID=2582893 RepID=UPI0011BE5548|nr:hypothetical protein [Shimia ponticola]